MPVSFDDSPEFFKVYIPEMSSQHLKIPPAFIDNFEGRIPEIFILKDQNGQNWLVDLERKESGFFLTNGWDQFRSDSSLELGNFLVFRYVGNSTFTVRIFGNSMCKKESVLIKVKSEDIEDPFEQFCILSNENSKDSPRRSKRARGSHDISPTKSLRSKCVRSPRQLKVPSWHLKV